MSYDNDVTARPRVEFGPCPADFPLDPLDTGGRDPRALTAGGLCYWKSHARFDLTGAEPVHTSRTVMQVTGQDGLQTAGRFTTTFNPQYERLIIHSIRLHRDGTVRDVANPEAFEVIRRELNLERAVYDGHMTAHAVIPDVREGDILDTVFSVVGANPALEGRFSWWFVLQWASPVAETRCTLVLPADRAITMRPLGETVIQPTDVVAGDVRTLDWIARDLPPKVNETGAPAHAVAFAAGHVADAASWAEVAEVFRPWYAPADILPPELEAAVANIAAATADPGDRAVRGLRLVQGALRYHSVSIGDGGYRPRAVEQIWATRYGDCKDGSRLAASILRRLGLDAVCALVNAGQGEDLPHVPPNVLAFNHCIVRVRIADRTVWFDPTMAVQAGDLDHLTQARFGHALPLVAEATLEAMPDWPLTTVCETTEVWTLPRVSGASAELELTTVYRSWRADNMRSWAANQGADKMERELREGLERDLASTLTAVGPVEIDDDTVGNMLVLKERYTVAQPYRALRGSDGVGFVSRDDIVGPGLPDPGTDRRRQPLQLGAPRRVSTTRVFHLPPDQPIEPWTERLEGPCGLVLESGFEWRTRREGVHRLTLNVGQPVLPATDQDRYRTFLEAARKTNGISFPAPHERTFAGGGSNGWNWMIWPGLVLLLVALRFLIAG